MNSRIYRFILFIFLIIIITEKSSGKSDWKGWNNSQQDSASDQKSAGARKKVGFLHNNIFIN